MGLWLFLNERCGRREWIWPCWGGDRRCCPGETPGVHRGLLAPGSLCAQPAPAQQVPASLVWKILEMDSF